MQQVLYTILYLFMCLVAIYFNLNTPCTVNHTLTTSIIQYYFGWSITFSQYSRTALGKFYIKPLPFIYRNTYLVIAVMPGNCFCNALNTLTSKRVFQLAPKFLRFLKVNFPK